MTGAFAEIDITPPLGTPKIGWIKTIIGDRVRDSLFARVCVLRSGDDGIAFIQLDVLSIGRQWVAEIRSEVERRFGFPGRNLMVAATHNHAGPDRNYIESLTGRIVDAFGDALARQQDVQVGVGRRFNVAFPENRRIVLREGIVKTHGAFSDPQSLFVEGPVDPELSVLAVRSATGQPLGCVVNFTMHPIEWGWDTTFSAGWPGVLAAELKRRGYGTPLFFNGALGNISVVRPNGEGSSPPMETIGRGLADDVERAVAEIGTFRSDLRVGGRSEVVRLPFREVTDEQIRGTVRGAQRFVDPNIYDELMPALVEEVRRKGTQVAEVQALFVGDEFAYVAIPAELFVQLGLSIKERSHPRHALVVGLANGMVGYVPHREAFGRGGYETTFFGSSKLAPGAGEMLVDSAARLVRGGIAEE